MSGSWPSNVRWPERGAHRGSRSSMIVDVRSRGGAATGQPVLRFTPGGDSRRKFGQSLPDDDCAFNMAGSS